MSFVVDAGKTVLGSLRATFSGGSGDVRVNGEDDGIGPRRSRSLEAASCLSGDRRQVPNTVEPGAVRRLGATWGRARAEANS